MHTAQISFALRVLLLSIALLPLPAAAQPCPSPPDLRDGWPVAAPEAQGLDATRLCAIGPRFEAWKEANAHAVLVVRNGVLVYERYFAGEDEKFGRPIGRVIYEADKPHDIRSVTKSVTSLAVGIAIGRGLIAGVDTPVLALFPEYADLRSPEKEKITLRHLLTMSAGFAWNENLPYSNPNNSERQLYVAADPVRFVLAQPVVTPPGASYNYNGGATLLLAAVVVKAAGRPFDQFVQETLFDPLGISDVEWVRGPGGLPWAASGLRMRPRDLAKIGQLVLSRGEWQGKRVVAADWIAQSTAPQINGEGLFFYGYQWWLGRSLVAQREVGWAAAVGWGGQRVFVVPDRNIVVVVTAGLYNGPVFQGAVGTTVLNGYVLPAMTR